MKPLIKKRLARALAFGAAAFLVGLGAAYMQLKMPAQHISPIAGAELGGAFMLTDQNGQTVTEKTFEGHYQLIYFGFTSCPAICPTELQKISRVTKLFEKEHPELAEKLQPVFVTIDPERDTVKVLKDYVSLYHPRLMGLTGTPLQIETMKHNYRVYAAKAEVKNQTDYSMDHSSFIYFMGADESLLGVYRAQDSAEAIYADVEKSMMTK